MLSIVTRSWRFASNSHWDLDKVTTAPRYYRMEIMGDRCGESSAVIVSRLPVRERHGVIGDNTVAITPRTEQKTYKCQTVCLVC